MTALRQPASGGPMKSQVAADGGWDGWRFQPGCCRFQIVRLLDIQSEQRNR